MDKADANSDWRAFFAHVGPRLILFARQWLPDTADAEDAVQEAFIRFWRKYRNPDEQHTGLLFAAVRHSALDHLRAENRRKRREAVSAELAPIEMATLTSNQWFTSANDSGQALEVALQRLAAEQREVLVLKIWGDLTFAQIGDVVGSSPHTAASRYRYAINALRKFLRPIYHE